MKVLMAHDYPPLEGGGLEINTFCVSKRLVEKKNHVALLTSRFSSETFSQKPRKEKAGVVILKVSQEKEIKKLVKQYDIIHVHLTFSFRPMALLVMKICEEEKKKYIVTLHTSLNHFFWRLENGEFCGMDVFCRVKNSLNSPFSRIVLPAPFLKDQLETCGIYKETEVIPNGIDIKKSKSLNKEKDFDVVFVGEISSLKGVLLLLEAVSMLEKRGKKITIAIVGGGEDAVVKGFKRIARKKRLNIHWFGYLRNGHVHEVIAKSRFLVLPSYSEVCPLILLESMSYHVPIIASDNPGNSFTLDNGNSGFLFRNGSSIDLAKTLEFVLNNKTKISGKVACGFDRVYSKFSLDAQVKNLLKEYKEIA